MVMKTALLIPKIDVEICNTNFIFVIIDYPGRICYTVTNHTPGGVYDTFD